jgi:hypothetical protein
VLGTRKLAVAGLEPVVEAASDAARDVELADAVRELARDPAFGQTSSWHGPSMGAPRERGAASVPWPGFIRSFGVRQHPESCAPSLPSRWPGHCARPPLILPSIVTPCVVGGPFRPACARPWLFSSVG